MHLRDELTPGDDQRIGLLVARTGFFHPGEIAIAVELAEERLGKGAASGYHFLLAEEEGGLAGYACYGPIPCTAASYDLYWIVVQPECQGRGLGRLLLERVEERIRADGGKRLYADTSQRPQYEGTRAFYLECGFRPEAVLSDFYEDGDGKVIFSKILTDSRQRSRGEEGKPDSLQPPLRGGGPL